MIRAALLLGLLAPPATAQDLAAQYAAAQGLFAASGINQDPGAAAEAMAALLPSLEGRWAEATVIAAGEADLPTDPMRIHCERGGRHLVQTSPHGFELRLAYGREGGVLVQRFDYAGYNTFLSSLDENAYLDRLGFGPDTDLDPPISIVLSAAPGFVELFHPSPDVLVLLGERQPPQIWLRCPA